MGRKGQQGQDHRVTEVLADTRAAKAVELRSTGLTYAQIGTQLGITEEGARQAVIRGLKQSSAQYQETPAEVLELSLMRLDQMLMRPYIKAVTTGDCGAVSLVLRIERQRVKLLGLRAGPGRPEEGACLTPSEVQGLEGEILELLFELVARGGPEFKEQLIETINAL